VAPLEITDAQIAALAPHERQALIWRLARPTAEVLGSPAAVRRMRQRRLILVIASAVALVPWTVYLGLTLPDRYVAPNWSLTWVGFDAILLSVFVLTAVLGALRRQLLVLTAFASGVLLLCDAWFDITTAGRADVWVSVATAVLGEVPVAVLLISGALRLMRLMAAQLWIIEPGMRLWHLRLPIGDALEPGTARGPG
jgi:hypothetical protein